MRTINLANPDGINNLGVLDTSKSFQSLLANPTETYNFEIKARSSFTAISKSVILKDSDGDTNLKLTKAGSRLQVISSNPGEITDGITRILDPGTYTLTVSVANQTGTDIFDGPGYDLMLSAEPGIASSIVWRNSLTDQTAFWDLDYTSLVDGAFVNNAPSFGSNSDWKLIGAVNSPINSSERILVWRNTVSDETAVWDVDAENKVIDGAFIENAPKLGSNSNWQLVNANVVNGNLRFLWRDAVADQTAYWTIDNTSSVIDGGFFTNTASLGSNSDWKLLDELVLEDKTQLIWRNAVSDETVYWTADASGAVVDAGFFDAPKVGAEWELTEVAQLGKDPQFFWRNTVTNEMATWFFDGTKLSSGAFIDAPRVGGEWQIASVISQYAEPLPMSLGGLSIDTALDVGVPNKTASLTDVVLPESSIFYTFTTKEPQYLDFTFDTQGLEKKVLNAEGKEFTLEPSQPLAAGKYYLQVTNPKTTITTATLNLFGNLTPKISLAGATSGTYEQPKGSALVITATPSIADSDSKELAFVRVSIVNLKDGADEKLTYDQAGSLIGGSYNATTGVFTFDAGGSLADYEAALKRISYSNTALNPDKSDRTFSITVADSWTDSAAVTTMLKLSFNTAPSLAADVSLGSILENASSLAGETIFTLLSNQFSDPDPDSSLKGIAIVGNTASSAQGRWEYSPDNRNWVSVSNVSETQALILSESARLRFVPTAFYNGTPDSLTIRAIDDTYTGDFSTITTDLVQNTTLLEPVVLDVTRNGGVSPFSGTTKSIGTSVLSVNQAPTFELGENVTIDKNASTQIIEAFVSNVTKGAPNESNQTLSYTITVDKPELFAANELPTINPSNGQISYKPSGIEGTATVTVTLKDDGGNANSGSDTTAKTFTITMTDNTPKVSLASAISSPFAQANGSAKVFSATPSITDNDSTALQSAKVSITNFSDGVDEKLIYTQGSSSISGSYDTAAGILTLTGNGSLAEYQAALEGISYSNTALNPNKNDRTFSITVNDGTADSEAVTTTMTLSFNTAPSLNANVSLPSSTEEMISTLLNSQFSDPDPNSSLRGIAIVGNTAPTSQGRWEYSPNGINWAVVGTVSETQALMLNALTELRFVPAPSYTGTPDSLTIRAIDDTYTGGFSTVTTTPGVPVLVGGVPMPSIPMTITTPVKRDVSRNGGVSAFSGTTNSIGTTVQPASIEVN